MVTELISVVKLGMPVVLLFVIGYMIERHYQSEESKESSAPMTGKEIINTTFNPIRGSTEGKTVRAHDETVSEQGQNFWEGKTPCWQMCHCPAEIRETCPAYRNQFLPCWEIEGTYCKLSDDGTKGEDTSICRLCRVYRRWGGGSPIQINLSGRGIDSSRRRLEELLEKEVSLSK